MDRTSRGLFKLALRPLKIHQIPEAQTGGAPAPTATRILSRMALFSLPSRGEPARAGRRAYFRSNIRSNCVRTKETSSAPKPATGRCTSPSIGGTDSDQTRKATVAAVIRHHGNG